MFIPVWYWSDISNKSPVNGNYYSYQKDNNKDNGMDGYAGIWGHFIDRLQIDIR